MNNAKTLKKLVLYEVYNILLDKYPIFSLLAGDVKLVNRKDSREFASLDDLDEFVKKSIAMVNPGIDVSVEFFKTNGSTSSILKDACLVERPTETQPEIPKVKIQPRTIDKTLSVLKAICTKRQFNSITISQLKGNVYIFTALRDLGYAQMNSIGMYKWSTKKSPEDVLEEVCQFIAVRTERQRSEYTAKKEAKVTPNTVTPTAPDKQLPVQEQIATLELNDQMCIDHLKGSKEFTYEIYRTRVIKEQLL